MSWYNDLFELGKRVVNIDSRVKQNTEEIEALRRDLQKLTGFTRNVAAAVQRNQDNSVHVNEKLVLELKLQLMQLRLDLNVNQGLLDHHNGSVAPPKVLSGTQDTLF